MVIKFIKLSRIKIKPNEEDEIETIYVSNISISSFWRIRESIEYEGCPKRVMEFTLIDYGTHPRDRVVETPEEILEKF